jgi:predicted tellurium resistance membrane protein TerC
MLDSIPWGEIFSLLTLSLMEIMMGIDTIVCISILTGTLPAAPQPKTRNLGLVLALIIRLGLLGAIQWIMGLTTTHCFCVGTWDVSDQKLMLLIGGLFLWG